MRTGVADVRAVLGEEVAGLADVEIEQALSLAGLHPDEELLVSHAQRVHRVLASMGVSGIDLPGDGPGSTPAVFTETVRSDEMRELEKAADGLSSSAIATALLAAGVDPAHGLAGVPRSKVSVVQGCLVAAFRTDVRGPVAPHLAPMDDGIRAAADALSTARNRGHRAFAAAQRAYDDALNASVREG